MEDRQCVAGVGPGEGNRAGGGDLSRGLFPHSLRLSADPLPGTGSVGIAGGGAEVRPVRPGAASQHPPTPPPPPPP